MMLNMLLGILVEVVANTGEGEKARIKEENFREAVSSILGEMDEDSNKKVSKDEFHKMKDHETVKAALEEMDIDANTMNQYANLLYAEDEDPDIGDNDGLTYDEVQNMIIRL